MKGDLLLSFLQFMHCCMLSFDRFKYENSGKLTDTSLPPSLLQSVHQLIEVSYSVSVIKDNLTVGVPICLNGSDLTTFERKYFENCGSSIV